MNVLVTGGAGYIGSITVKALVAQGHEVVVVDDLRTGHAAAVQGARLLRQPVQDRPALTRALREHRVDGVLHFAASCYVGDSVRDPLGYYENNVVGTLRLVEACVDAGVRPLVFSSTCATYGVPERMPIDEDTPQRPVNPYGATKLAAEGLLRDAAHAHGLRPMFLRYFNAAGADPDGALGEDHRPETHLLPNAVRAALGRLDVLEIFGDDYPTPDGTCIRDYVHVADLASAHVLALTRARDGATCEAINLGSGRGFSVREVVAAVAKAAGRPVPVAMRPRRAGDPPQLVASAMRARTLLGWEPRLDDLDAIVETTMRWMRAHPDGYGPVAGPGGRGSGGERHGADAQA